MTITINDSENQYNIEELELIIQESYRKGRKSGGCVVRSLLFVLLNTFNVPIRCFYCGANNPVIAHIIPIGKGGKALDFGNITFLCGKCHKKYDSGQLPNYIPESLKHKMEIKYE